MGNVLLVRRGSRRKPKAATEGATASCRRCTVFRFGFVTVGQSACGRGLARASALTYKTNHSDTETKDPAAEESAAQIELTDYSAMQS